VLKRLPKELVLDYSTWICGVPVNDNYTSKNSKGKGKTRLLNYEGEMCCLGQFALQSGVKREDILDLAEPSEINEQIYGLGTIVSGARFIDNSKFSIKAMVINDDKKTTIAEKVKALKRLCGHFKRKLTLKNFPKSILEEVNRRGKN